MARQSSPAASPGVQAGIERPAEPMEALLSEAVSTARELFLRLEWGIRSGSLPLGSRMLTERRVAELAGLSRSTVRSAFDRLEREGLISRRVGQGTFVSSNLRGKAGPSARHPAPGDLLEFRMLFEPQLAEHLVLRASDETLSDIAQFVMESRDVRDWRDTEAVDAEFHRRLCCASGNTVFLAIADVVTAARNEQAWLQLKERRFDWKRWERYQREHEEIIAALQERDGHRAQHLLRDHLAGVRQGFFVPSRS